MTGHLRFNKNHLRRFRFSQFAEDGGDLARLYVLAFNTGVVKVGRTKLIQTRFTNHISMAAVHGAEPAGAWVSRPHANAASNEMHLIQYCARAAKARVAAEYFRGIQLDDVVGRAEQLTYYSSHDDWAAALEATRLSVPATRTTRVGGHDEALFRGDVLVMLMTARNKTVAGLAVEIGLDRGTLFRLRRGEANPTFNVVVALASVLEVPIDAFAMPPAALALDTGDDLYELPGTSRRVPAAGPGSDGAQLQIPGFATDAYADPSLPASRGGVGAPASGCVVVSGSVSPRPGPGTT